MIVIDTSVLLAVAHVRHIHHEASRDLWNSCRAGDTAVNTHALAEIYSGMTSMPSGFRLSPRNAMAAVDTFLQRLTPIALSPDEYVEAIRAASRLGITGGSIFDALHVACARKVRAERIYTWNLRHFQLVAPDLGNRIVTP